MPDGTIVMNRVRTNILKLCSDWIRLAFSENVKKYHVHCLGFVHYLTTPEQQALIGHLQGATVVN